MKYIYQDQETNCVSACLASILELDIKEVPNFFNYNYKKQWKDINDWLDKHDLMTCTWADTGLKEIQKNHKNSGYGIVCMRHKDDKCIAHAFVAVNGVVIHDPWHTTSHINKFDEKSATYIGLMKKFKRK